MLYDTGARFSRKFDTGAAVVVPYLRHQLIDRIHTLVISHGDNDHIGGMQSVLAAVDTTQRLSSVPNRVPGAEPCFTGQQWNWDEVTFTILSPESLNPPPHNNSSCVIKVQGRYGSLLLTGDIEHVVEAYLVRKYGELLKADVLLVPHQGKSDIFFSIFYRHGCPQVCDCFGRAPEQIRASSGRCHQSISRKKHQAIQHGTRWCGDTSLNWRRDRRRAVPFRKQTLLVWTMKRHP